MSNHKRMHSSTVYILQKNILNISICINFWQISIDDMILTVDWSLIDKSKDC